MASPLDYLMGLGETGATLGTGAISGLLGMPYGLYKGVTSGKYGTPQGVKIAEQEAANFMARNTYQPRTAQGQQNLQQLAGLLESTKLPPVIPEAALLGQIPRQAYAAQAERAGMAAERALAPVVERTMQRGGLPAQLMQDLTQGSRSQIFIGEKSKSWNKKAADTALQMEKQGATPQDIWANTGTVRGPDGKLRQEISDAEALLTNKQKDFEGKLHETLQHPSLYENYPALQYYDTEIQSQIALPEHLKKSLIGKGSGSFTEKDFLTDEPKITAQAYSNEDTGTLLHEIQHAIQQKEGFARGGSPAQGQDAPFIYGVGESSKRLKEVEQLLEKTPYLSKEYDNLILELEKLSKKAESEAAFEGYRRLAGEAEARLTSARAKLSPEERLKYFPFEERSFENPYIEQNGNFNPYGLDVSPSDLIIRGGLLD